MKELTDKDKEECGNLKARLWLSIAKIVEEETKELNVEATKLFTATLAELVYNQLLVVGDDLESFAKHAKRKTILPADMYMITRKNEGLTQILKDYENEIKQSDAKTNLNINNTNINNSEINSNVQSNISNTKNEANLSVLDDIDFSEIHDSDEIEDDTLDDSLDDSLNEKLNQTANRTTKR
ncbi:Mhf1p ASCRUDRAFT_79149 [Ascoidea rubescens DSM 1968]|uniref:Histone-fold-containing protein n=1 Tax=Ascoidea rubescens DSM 1968 TaxID=1344418 RepID=A0A1D2VRS0_9ASCO|nr:hypothetical protein ASCRUDRAFT_79149 [Ascoidea rubescens DSM 1968]ODV64267.1 hypothetical protein ASCRUDRAFT_79149 [Ascoidea rubescens DSM 1968]